VHQAITTATNLNPHSSLLASGYAWLGGVSWADLAGWAGDTTHLVPGAEPSMGPDDYKSDLDAVNIAAIVREQGLSYTDAANLYYADLAAGRYTRAEKFLEHASYDDIEKVILNDSGYDTVVNHGGRVSTRIHHVPTLEELKELNPDGYWFLMSLKAGSNELLGR